MALDPPAARRTPSGRRVPAGILRLAAALAILAALLGPAAATSVALMTASAASSGSTFASWTWTFYLHNNPTPPVGSTVAQANLAMDGSAPGGLVGYVYDTNLDTQVGRRINRTGSGPAESDLHLYQNWLSGPFPTSHRIAGTATLDFWSGTSTFKKNKAGTIVAYLRDLDPALGLYTEIASATLSVPDWQGGSGTWVRRQLGVGVASYTIAAGHRLELKLETTGSPGDPDMLVMYDVVAEPSALTIP